MTWAHSLTKSFAVLMPCVCKSASSLSSTAGSMTTPLPITFTVLGSKIPAGTTCNLNAPRSFTTV